MSSQRQKRSLPLVAIVGRPNVGKSTLFNRISGTDKAIVESAPGVTRDRIYADVKWGGREFSVVDTAGLEPPDGSAGETEAKEQAEIAIEEADLVVMLLNGVENPVPQDEEIMRMLRKNGKNVFCLVNKIDHKNHERLVDNFHSLGELKLRGISALHGRNMYELLDDIAEALPRPARTEGTESGDPPTRIAVLGKPNVGKSTLVNAILRSGRMATGSAPGTTRDAVDTRFRRNSRDYVITDTAGVRRRPAIKGAVERLATLKAIRSIAACDVAVLVIDAAPGPSRQDTRLARLVEDRGKPAVIVLNKWDLAPEHVTQAKGVAEKTAEHFGGALYFAPVLTASALKGRGIHKLLEAVDDVRRSSEKRIPTRKLNDFLATIVRGGPSVFRGRELKAYYMTQVSTRPPGFVIFTNSAGGGVPPHYSRHVERRIREKFGFEGAPIRLFFREREPKTG